VWEYGSMGVWEYGSVGVWEYGSKGVWECGGFSTRVGVRWDSARVGVRECGSKGRCSTRVTLTLFLGLKAQVLPAERGLPLGPAIALPAYAAPPSHPFYSSTATAY
jgi:hypothetical protein